MEERRGMRASDVAKERLMERRREV
jgi:hypothetical protein